MNIILKSQKKGDKKDNDIDLDALTHLQISKTQKRLGRAIAQVENIRRELVKML